MKPFLQGKRNLGTTALAAPRPKAIPGLGKAQVVAQTTAAPNVEVVKEGDKVVRLVITCVCGERIEVECLYPAGG